MAQRFDFERRASGVLLHISSLPGGCGCGDIGPVAHRFVDFLAAAGQHWWQMLPVGPIGPGDSPYMSPSALAGNPLFVSLEVLVRDGLLRRGDLPTPRSIRVEQADYPAANRARHAALRLAYERFCVGAAARDRGAFERFERTEKAWLADHALFAALDAAAGGVNWTKWPVQLRRRHPAHLRAAREALSEEVRYHAFAQFLFAKQWDALRTHAHVRGVGLLGDIPIYVAHHSADVWAHPELFELDRDGRMVAESGVPPDRFSSRGQCWHTPVYRWPAHVRSRFAWWVERFRQNFRRFDAARIDHFIGLHRYWRIPAGSKTAAPGRWCPGPDAALLERVRKAFGSLPIIAEDLGAATPGVHALRRRFGYPGMKVLHWAFCRGDASSGHLPHRHEPGFVVYPGTHDNDTTRGWWAERLRAAKRDAAARREVAYARAYLGTDGREIHADLVRLAWSSVANTAVAAMQDLLGLDGARRMNNPATESGNWRWRMLPDAATPAIAARLRELTERFGRLVQD